MYVEYMKAIGMRIRVVRVPYSEIVLFFKCERDLEISIGIDKYEGIRHVVCENDFKNKCFHFTIEHSTFEMIEEGSSCPLYEGRLVKLSRKIPQELRYMQVNYILYGWVNKMVYACDYNY